MLRKISITFIVFWLVISSYPSIINEGADANDKRSNVTFDRYVTYISEYKKLKPNEILTYTAKFFIGKPYIASTLEKEGSENLVVNLDEFDCTTFVETCLALTQAVIADELTFDQFKANLQLIRYRGGRINGYASRLHYMIDWIADAESKKILKNVSKFLGGELKSKKVNFMSTHPELYAKLRNDKYQVDKIAQIEEDISLKDYVVIPKEKILIVGDAILNGDIVIFATAIDGLDYSHLGIAYHEKGILRMIHASSVSRKVVVESRSLYEYCRTTRNNTGITILRFENLVSN